MNIVFILSVPLLFLLLFFTQSCDGRNYRHVSAEMVTTNQLVINQTNCAKNETPIFVHTAAVTSGKYFDRRMTIRKTWGKEAKEAGMKVIFVIGVPRNLTFQKAIRAEAKQYGDMLQFNFIEDYYNLTLKAVAELKWAWRHCANSTRYLMKVDDDVLVNVPLLKNWVTEGRIPSGITGRVMTTPANRQFGHKWYMPAEYYDKSSYKFLSGFSYLLSMNRLKKLLDAIKRYRGPILDIDDLWLTGVMVDYGKVRRYNNHRFRYYCGLDECTMAGSLVMHACPQSRDTQVMYNVWRQSTGIGTSAGNGGGSGGTFTPWWCWDDPFERSSLDQFTRSQGGNGNGNGNSVNSISSSSNNNVVVGGSGSPGGSPGNGGGSGNRSSTDSRLFNFNLGDLRFIVQSR